MSRGFGGDTMTFTPPDGIEVDIIPTDGTEVLQGPETPDGKRSVYLHNGSQYEIEITNDRDKHIAVLVLIDDKDATPTPLIVSSDSRRVVKGFTLGRKSVGRMGGKMITKTQIEGFVARRQHTASGGRVNMSLGEIRIIFLPTCWVNAEAGKHFNIHPPSKSKSRGRAHTDVLVTEGGEHYSQSGYHGTTRNRRVIWDRKKKKPLGVSGWTIYDYTTYCDSQYIEFL